MKEPLFLQIEDVLAFHASQIRQHGGSPGVRDAGLLQSALAMPEAAFGGEYLHKDLHEMAAAYLFHIVSNHPFIDGNKRAGTAAALTFLEVNGSPLHAKTKELERLVLGVASGKITKPEIAAFFEKNSVQGKLGPRPPTSRRGLPG